MIDEHSWVRLKQSRFKVGLSRAALLAVLATAMLGAAYAAPAPAPADTQPKASPPAANSGIRPSTGLKLEPVPPAPAKVEQLRKAAAEGLLGQAVQDAKGDVFGNVADVLIDADGTTHAAVIQYTGFFGIGDRQVAVDWKALEFRVEGDHIAIRVRLDPDKLKAMPEYKTEAASVPVATQSSLAPAKPH